MGRQSRAKQGPPRRVPEGTCHTPLHSRTRPPPTPTGASQHTPKASFMTAPGPDEPKPWEHTMEARLLATADSTRSLPAKQMVLAEINRAPGAPEQPGETGTSPPTQQGAPLQICREAAAAPRGTLSTLKRATRAPVTGSARERPWITSGISS